MANLTERNAVLIGKNKTLTEKVTEMRDKCNTTDEENEVLRERVVVLQDNLTKTKSEWEQTSAELARVTDSYTKTMDDAKELHLKVSPLFNICLLFIFSFHFLSLFFCVF